MRLTYGKPRSEVLKYQDYWYCLKDSSEYFNKKTKYDTPIISIQKKEKKRKSFNSNLKIKRDESILKLQLEKPTIPDISNQTFEMQDKTSEFDEDITLLWTKFDPNKKGWISKSQLFELAKLALE